MEAGSPFAFVVRSVALIAVAMLFVGLSGCGSEQEAEAEEATAQVSGTVTFAGKPVSGLNVVLYSLKTGSAGEAPLDRGGKFQFEGSLVPGEYTVYLSGQGRIPEKFASETSSDYSVTLKEGANQLPIPLD